MALISTRNIRRSASSVGLVSNITMPVPDGNILDSNIDGSDLRHISDIFRLIPSVPIIDITPSTFCFTVYTCKEIDFTVSIEKEAVFTMQFKNRC